MAKVDLYGPGVAAFEYKDDKPTYWTEYLSWSISKNLENMQAAGFILDDGQDISIQLTEDDTTIITSILTAIDDYAVQQEEDAVISESGLPVPTPGKSPLAPLLGAIEKLLSGLPIGKIILIIRAVWTILNVIKAIRDVLRGGTGGNTDLTKLLKTALITTEDSEDKAILLKVNEAIETLKYNDEEIDLGAFRAYLRSKVIEY
jgi:hypothetical protein